MNSPSIRASVGAGGAALAVVGAVAIATSPLTGFAVSITLATLALVAFVAQAGRIKAEQRLVYRPVYARRPNVRRGVKSYDD